MLNKSRVGLFLLKLKAFPMNRLRSNNWAIDAVDLQLLNALATDARISTAELSRVVGLSPPSVTERIRRMEDVGLIEGYAARINPRVLGFSLAAWLRIRPVPGQLQRVVSILENLPEIVQCDRVTGEDCFLARAHVRSVEELERLIDKIIPYAMTNTSIIQSSPVTHRLPPLLGS